jgi:hypothetical protein
MKITEILKELREADAGMITQEKWWRISKSFSPALHPLTTGLSDIVGGIVTILSWGKLRAECTLISAFRELSLDDCKDQEKPDAPS